MTASDISIRESREHERDEILAIHLDAFGDVEGPMISKLVGELMDDATGKPICSLVAETDGLLIGHVMFTSVAIEPDLGHVIAKILAPIAVVKDRQRQGIGGRLIHTGLSQLKDSGVNRVFVLGYPDYYTRFGFEPAGANGLQASYPILPKNSDAWMVTELEAGAIANRKGTVRCSKALDHPQYWIE